MSPPPPFMDTAIFSLCWSPIFLKRMTSFFLSWRYELNMIPGWSSLDIASSLLSVYRKHLQALYKRWVCVEFAAPGLLHWKLSKILFCFPQGLGFVDTLYKFCTEHHFKTDFECEKWVLLLLQLVDVTGDDHPEVHLRSFLSMSTHSVVVKKYREDIIKHVSARNCLTASRLYLHVEHLIMCSPYYFLFRWLARHVPSSHSSHYKSSSLSIRPFPSGQTRWGVVQPHSAVTQTH